MIDGILSSARKLFTQENYKDALPLYEEYFKTSTQPTDVALYEYAWCLQERLRYAESITLTRQILAKDPNDVNALLNYALCMGKQDRHQEALEVFQKIFHIDANFSRLVGYYAYLLERTGNLVDAEKYYKRGMQLEPDNLWYLSHYAFYLQKADRLPEAETYFLRVIQLDPGNTWVIKRYAFLRDTLYGQQSASEYFEANIRREPENYNHYLNFSEFLLIKGQPQRALLLLGDIPAATVPLVMRIIILFYRAVCHLYLRDLIEVQSAIEQLKILAKDYPSYIHRDYTALKADVEKRFDDEQRLFFSRLVAIASNIEKADASLKQT